MKKMKNLISITLLFAALILTSCSSDDNETPLDNSGTTTGDYWPMAIGNQWTMKQNGSVKEPVKISATDVFNGYTYFKVLGQLEFGDFIGVEKESWITKKGATYFVKVGEIKFTKDGINLIAQGYELPVLKDDLGVGESWSGEIKQEVTGIPGIPLIITSYYTGTILEKNVELTVNGVTYKNVLKMKLLQEATIDDEKVILNGEYWYAQNVGPIKIISETNGKKIESILVDYIVKK